MPMHMWLSAIVPFVYLQVFETSPHRGGSAEILNLARMFFFFCREEPVGAEPEYLGDPGRPTRQRPASLTPLPP